MKKEVLAKRAKVTNSLAGIRAIIEESSAIANSNLLAIVNCLKDNDFTVTFKNGWYNCNQYRFGNGAMGFCLKDMEDYGRTPKKWDAENLMPTPREVLEFMTGVKLRTTEKVDVKKIKKVVVLDKPISVPKEPTKPAEPTLEELNGLRKKGIMKVKRIKDPDNVVIQIRELFNHRGFRVLFNKIARRFERGEIRSKKFRELTIDLITTIDFTPPLEPAPKFVPLQWYNIKELIENEKTVTFTTDKAILEMSKSEFLAKYCLHKYPRWMPQMMKAIEGKITWEDFIENPDVRDRFQHYFSKSIMNNDKLYEALVQLLEDENDEQPLLCAFNNTVRNELKKGDRIKIHFKDECCHYEARVLDTSNGIEVMFENGTINKLLKHQEWEKITTPTPADKK